MTVPVGQSAISIRGSVLLILLLNVRVDGLLITLQDALGDGSVGDAFVTPGVHTVTISNAADTAVLFEETVDCPECNAAAVTPTPAAPGATTPPAPPTDVEGDSGSSSNLPIFLVLMVMASVGVALVLRGVRNS